MNIFYVDEDPTKAAQALVDAHVVKMILESAQLLSTAHRIADGRVEFHGMNRSLKLPDPVLESNLYKAAYANHPCAVWTRKTAGNYRWLYTHFISLIDEYHFRYGKRHASSFLIEHLVRPPKNVPIINVVTPVAQAMPVEYMRTPNAMHNYREYYAIDKEHLHKWTRRRPPYWIALWHPEMYEDELNALDA